MGVSYFSFFDNVTINNQQMKDIFDSFTINTMLPNGNNLFINYVIKDGDTPESLALKFYSDSKYSWVILLCNNMFDYHYDFPMTSSEIEKYSQKYYDEFLSITGNNPENKSLQDIYYEFYEENERKRNIKYLDVAHLPDLIFQLDNYGK